MANPLFEKYGNQGNTPNNGFANFMQNFNNFKNTFKGNPRETVQTMLSNGQITQEQFNKAQSMAQQIMQFMPK